MYRAQILLEKWQHEALRSLSERQGKSLSQILREILGKALAPARKNPQNRLQGIEGLGKDTKASGKAHDHYLYGKK